MVRQLLFKYLVFTVFCAMAIQCPVMAAQTSPMVIVVDGGTAHQASGTEMVKQGVKKIGEEVTSSIKWGASIVGSFYLGRQFQLIKSRGMSALWCDKDGVARIFGVHTPIVFATALGVVAFYGVYKAGLLKKMYSSDEAQEHEEGPMAV